jgi:DNA transformation protein and related proteins
MFGGAGIYREAVMFGLVSDGEIFLKCDNDTSTRFREAGCRPFVYSRRGKSVDMSYWSLPDEALDDSELLKAWADLAYQAALKAKKARQAA